MALSTTVGLSVVANVVNTLTLGASTASLASSFGTSFADGAAAGQANRAYWATRTLTASTSETLDLAGSLTDPFGATITLARLKVLVVSADAANTNNVLVGGASSNAVASLFSAVNDVAIVRPGSTLAWIAGAADATGYAVTAATGDLLQIANSGAGTSVTYTIIAIGAAT
jgi:hypothetical protein